MDPIESALRDNTFWDTITIAEKSFEIRRVRNIDILLDAIPEDEFKMDEKMPYWADIWPSSIALAEFIIENQKDFFGKTILELGCGLGLVGIAASSIGADVIFTDYDLHALNFTRENFYRNFKRSATVQLLDWRNPGDMNNYNCIVAADVIYEKRWLEPIIDVIDKKLAANGTAYVANPDRTVSREIFSLIDDKTWQRESLLKRITVYDKLHTITINRISKC
jgi:predicted nicotinamide N-methyase